MLLVAVGSTLSNIVLMAQSRSSETHPKLGEDYNETFYPAVKFTTLRFLPTLAASRYLEIQHMDVKAALLHGVVKEDVHLKQPEGFVNPAPSNHACKLRKVIYESMKASRAWNETLKCFSTLLRVGLITRFTISTLAATFSGSCSMLTISSS